MKLYLTLTVLHFCLCQSIKAQESNDYNMVGTRVLDQLVAHINSAKVTSFTLVLDSNSAINSEPSKLVEIEKKDVRSFVEFLKKPSSFSRIETGCQSWLVAKTTRELLFAGPLEILAGIDLDKDRLILRLYTHEPTVDIVDLIYDDQIFLDWLSKRRK